MAQGEIQAFTGLRPHQRAAWHMFLVQLGVLTIERAGWPRDPQEWADSLRGLTDFGDDAWRLVVTDRDRPAFMQPSDPGGLKWSTVLTPDALDMLITAKNHDVKSRIAVDGLADDWIFALVTLQTMEGYNGSGNYGIARMNGGSSSRSMLTAAPASEHGRIDLSRWWRRDVERLLRFRTNNTESKLKPGGDALLWCLPWPDGQKLAVSELDPLFIEVCRRIRLSNVKGMLQAERSKSKAARIDAKAFKGALEDPWTPIDRTESKALTLGERDFSYKLIKNLLFGSNWEKPLLATVDEGEDSADLLLVADAISRGNSRTDGLKRRVIQLPSSNAWYADDAAAVSEILVEEIKNVDAALREGIALFVARGDYEKVGKAERLAAADARRRFDRYADDLFFPALWRRVEAERSGNAEREQQSFRAQLIQSARIELETAMNARPIAHAWAPRAAVRAKVRFHGILRKSQMIED